MDSEGIIQPGLEGLSLRDLQTLHFIIMDARAQEARSQVDLEEAPGPKTQYPASWSPAKSTAQPSWMFKYKKKQKTHICQRKDILRMFSLPWQSWDWDYVLSLQRESV